MEILKNACIIIALLLALSCDSENSWDCIQKRGDIITERFTEFPAFNDLVLYDDISLEIIEDDEEYFELEAGENLIPEITYSLDRDSLIWTNENSCTWARAYRNPILKWHTSKTTIRVISLSSGLVYAQDTLRNTIHFTSEDVSGDFEVKVNNSRSIISANSSANFYISGKTHELVIRSYFSDGKYNCKELTSNYANILQRGFNDITVTVSEELTGSIENAGQIIYYGDPEVVDVDVSRGGALIKGD